MHMVKRVVPLILLINLFALICLAEQKTEKLPEGLFMLTKSSSEGVYVTRYPCNVYITPPHSLIPTKGFVI